MFFTSKCMVLLCICELLKNIQSHNRFFSEEQVRAPTL